MDLNFCIAGIASTAFSSMCVCLPVHDEPSNDPSSHDGGSIPDQDIDAQEMVEAWIYLTVPNHGTYRLRDVLTEGSAGWAAFADYGEPIESYEPINIFTPNLSPNRIGLVVLMPIVYCMGDFNFDRIIDAQDLVLFAQAYLAGDLSADLTGDGQIDIADQLFFFELATGGCIPIA